MEKLQERLVPRGRAEIKSLELEVKQHG